MRVYCPTVMAKLQVAVVAATLAFAASGSQAKANLITNGSFENGINPGGFTTLLAGNNTSITSWTVSSGSIDYIGTHWTASDGVRSLDLSGGGPGSVSQTFTTTVGLQYRVSFDLSGNPDNPAAAAGIRTVQVSAGADSAIFSFDTIAEGNTRPNMMWTPQFFLFTATGPSTTLTFAGLTPGAWGPAIDNVAVVAVPEPTSLAIFGVLTAGAAGYFGLRRRMKVAARAFAATSKNLDSLFW